MVIQHKRGRKDMQKLVMYRLIADEGKLITNGKDITAQVIDVAPNRNPDEFYEIDDPDSKKE